MANPNPILPSSRPKLRERESHTHCLAVEKGPRSYRVNFIHAAIPATGHVEYPHRPERMAYDSPLARKAAILAVENLRAGSSGRCCMGMVTAQYDETFHPKYQFLSDEDADFVSSFFVILHPEHLDAVPYEADGSLHVKEHEEKVDDVKSS